MFCAECGRTIDNHSKKCLYCEGEINKKVAKKNPIITALKVVAGIICVLFMDFILICLLACASAIITESEKVLYFMLSIFFVGMFLATGFVLGKICGSVKNTFRTIGKCIGIGSFIFIALGFFGVEGEAGAEISGLTFIVISLSIGVFIFGIVKKKIKAIIIPAIIVVVYGLMLYGVANDEPYFIRKIQGEDFIGIWAIYALIIITIASIIEVIYTITYSKIKGKIAKEKIYDDSDLMLLQEFDRDRKSVV